MNTYHRFAACLLLCLTAMAPPLRAQDATLRYRWTRGEEFRYRHTQQSTMTMSGTGLPPGIGASSIDSTLTQMLRTVVDDVAADGTVTLRQLVDAVRMDINTPFGRSVFDSAATGSTPASDPLGNSMAAAYSAMVGRAITIVIAPGGTVQKVEGMSALLERMQNAQPAVIPAAALEELKNSFSDNAAGYMLERGFASFPGRPLKPGETWDDQLTVNLPMVGAMSTFRTWTFQGVERRNGVETARLTSTFTIKSDLNATPGAAPLPLSLEPGQNSGESEMLFDVARGRLVRLTTHMTQEMKMTMPGPGGGPAATMQTLGKTTVVLELLDAASR